MAIKAKPEIAQLVDLLERAYRVKSWHGTNLRGSLRGLKLDQILWRPGRGRHNIWEIAIHCAYWKYAIFRRLEKLDRGGFPRIPSDWPNLPEKPDMKAWKSDLALLDKYHKELIGAVADFPVLGLDKKSLSNEFTVSQLIQGAASHDLYHSEQIQLIKKLYKKILVSGVFS